MTTASPSPTTWRPVTPRCRDLAEKLVEEWGELMEWGVFEVEGGAEVV